jgi:nicotinamide-nucleotide amidase
MAPRRRELGREVSSLTSLAERPDEEKAGFELRRLARISVRDYLIRFAFGALVSALAGGVTLVFGPRWGGLFLAFPAILPATLTLLEKRDGLPQAASDVRGAAIGAIGLIGFAIVGALLMARSSGLALVAALAAWATIALLIYRGLRLIAAVAGERQYLPEIPTVEAEPVIQALRSHHATLALAESCTGGTIAALLTNVPGAGEVVRGGFVTWSDQAKEGCLHVDPALIARHGAVSAEVAHAMALGAKQALGADTGLAITGIEGKPKDGQPPGLTYVCVIVADGRSWVRRHVHDHGAGRNRERDVRMALLHLHQALVSE